MLPVSQDAEPPNEGDYRDAAGLNHMCVDCRRMRWNSPEGEKWVLIEEFLVRLPSQVSHGLCPECARRMIRSSRWTIAGYSKNSMLGGQN